MIYVGIAMILKENDGLIYFNCILKLKSLINFCKELPCSNMTEYGHYNTDYQLECLFLHNVFKYEEMKKVNLLDYSKHGSRAK